MEKILVKNTVFVFDLDDTLYPEHTYETSGIQFVYNIISERIVGFKNYISLDYLLLNRHLWIDLIMKAIGGNHIVNKEELLELYRGHTPKIKLYNDSELFLNKLKDLNADIALITDGRSVAQRKKIEALNLHFYTNDFFISEEIGYKKPSPQSFKLIMEKYPGLAYIYFGDNLKKDFIAPNKLGWQTICILNRGQNIHEQNFETLVVYKPKILIKSFNDLSLL